jgi:anaerobic selenocysteine-containing dehydrogenase
MSMVHASMGMNDPASAHLRSEPAIVAGLARATLGERSKIAWEELVADYDRIRNAIEDIFPIFQGYNARVRIPGGFHLTSAARERIWLTPSGRATFLVFKDLDEDPVQADDVLWLTTIRSHDQYNTTIYSSSDRYRGVFGRRDVLFINSAEMAKRNLAAKDRVDIITASTDGIERRMRDLMVVEYKLPDGCCAAYYPEANPLVPLYARDALSHTPSSKAIPIRIVRADEIQREAAGA